MQANTNHEGGGTSASVQAFAARNLHLLTAIENTLDRISADRHILHAMTNDMDSILAGLKAKPSVAAIDPEGRICNLLNRCMESASRIYRDATDKHSAACADTRLTSEDSVVDAYSEYLESLRGFHDVLAEFLEWTETHDALLDAVGTRTYATADELFEALTLKS